MNLTIYYSERVYNALLSFYPAAFRVRFSREMMQIFRDCLHEALEKGQAAVLVAFWLLAVRDLGVSVLRERRREWLAPIGADHPLTAIVDLTLIPGIVTTNLVVLGPVLALLVRGSDTMSWDQFVMTSGFFSIATGTLVFVASLVITKLRPTVRLWVKLSA
jgi:hypothetical protein